MTIRLLATAGALAALPLSGAAAGEPRARVLQEGIEFHLDESYRLDGRLKATGGEAWLRLEVATGDGTPIASHETPRASDGAEWTYVARETEPVIGRGNAAATARITLLHAGEAAVEDVVLAPSSPLVFSNGGMEAPLDAKGRLPYWSEERDDALLPGKKAGTLELDAASPRSGRASLAVRRTGDWQAAASVNFPVPAWSDRFEIRSSARAAAGTVAQVLAVWTDDGGRVLRVDHSPALAAAAWEQLVAGPLEVPGGATAVRAVLAAHNAGAPAAPGAAWFDDVDLRTLPPRARQVRVAVNQIGYELRGPKSAVVLTNFFPAGGANGSLRLLDDKGEAVVRLPLAPSGRMRGEGGADWGWYFWRADFSSYEREGRYRLEAAVDGVEGASFPFALGPDLLFREAAPLAVEFFHVQRCGFAVPGWHAACHLDDARLPDGSHRDLTGGWHSAGDYNKITWEYGDGGAAYALARAAAAAPAFFAPLDRDGDGLPDILDEAWWGAKYLARLAREDGGFLKDIQQGPDRQAWMRWVPPEKQTDNVPGTPDDPIVLAGDGNSPLAAGAWALIGKLLAARGIASGYAALAARQWAARTRDEAAVADPLLLLSALELHRATGEERFLTFARASAERLLAGRGGKGGRLRGGYGDSGDVPAAALAHFALEFPKEPLAAAVRASLQEHLERILLEPRNPFGVTRQKAGGEGVEGYYFEPTSVYGQSFLFGCRAWSALSIHRLLGDRRALGYAIDQLDFLLGKNPYLLCLLEGKGSCNPPRYHHRYDSIPGRERGAVPGAIPNGFVRDVGGHDRPGFDLSTGGRPHPSYRTSEPWLVHDVFFLLAVTALHEAVEPQAR